MKKLFFLLFSVSALFYSCSSDDDNFTQTESNPVTKTYPVELNIKSDAFSIDKTPLTKASFSDSQYLLQVVVYKETGEVHSDSITLSENLKSIMNEDGTLPFTLRLPEGKYHLALLFTGYSTMMTGRPNNYIKTDNYFKDTFSSFYQDMAVNYFHNSYVYYNNIDLTVSSTSDNKIDSITLRPKWSTVYLSINDPQKIKFPEGAEYVEFAVLPNNSGVEIKSGLATIKNRDLTPSFYDKKYLSSLSKSLELKYYIAETADHENDIKIRLTFKKDQGYQDSTIVEKKIIPINRKAENGYIYRLSGNLGDNNNNNNQSMNISLGQFNPEDVQINF